MKNYPTQKGSCQLCSRPPHTHQLTLSFLHKKLAYLHSHHCFPAFQQPADEECEGLARLMKILRVSGPQNGQFQQPCLHLKWQRKIRRSLGCGAARVDYLCHQIADKIAQRNYQLHVLEIQVKNVGLRAQGILEEPTVKREEHVPSKEGQQKEKGSMWDIELPRLRTQPSLQDSRALVQSYPYHLY